MARPTLPLTDAQIRQAKAADKPLKLFDGGGLYLLATAGSKGWRFKYRFADKEKLISFGNYPGISLAEPRKERERARSLLTKGIDFSLARKAERQEEAARLSNTFRSLATEWHGKQAHLARKTLDMTWRRLEHPGGEDEDEKPALRAALQAARCHPETTARPDRRRPLRLPLAALCRQANQRQYLERRLAAHR